MKIVQLNTDDIAGGAARAAYRLHKGLRQAGMDCRMPVRHKTSADDSVVSVIHRSTDQNNNEALFLHIAQEQYINAHRTGISNTLFSLPYPGYDLSQTPLARDADIINLHWIAYFQSLVTLRKLFDLGKPIVWTLHDQWAFTGGCHYSAGCMKYRSDCSACPQLADDPFDLAAAVLKDKLELFKEANLTIVTPSKWLAECARESMLFKKCRVEVIPNSLETDTFRPVPKAEAKKSLKIAEDTLTLLFSAHAGWEKRKGFHELLAATELCKSDAGFMKLLNENKVAILCFGQPSGELMASGIPVISLGYLDTDEEIKDAYSAADMFILPSQEDNLPNTMLEALSCGTPVVAFDIGGIPDVVINDVNGKLVPAQDIKGLSEAMLDLILNPAKRERMGKHGREQMLNGYTLNRQAENYLGLYRDLLDKKPKIKTSGIHPENSSDKENREFAIIDTSLGPHFQAIYDLILFNALKEHIPISQQKINECEADRTARLEIIHSQAQTFREQLSKSEEDRASRLEVIQSQGNQIADLQKTLSEQQNSLYEYKAIAKQACPALYETGGDLQVLAKLFRTEKIVFGKEETSLYLHSGWGQDETFADDGSTINWAIGKSASLFLALPKDKVRLNVKVRAFELPKPQEITVKIDGREMGKWTLSNKWQWEQHSMLINPDNHRKAVSLIEFAFSQNIKIDDRELAVMFESLTIN